MAGGRPRWLGGWPLVAALVLHALGAAATGLQVTPTSLTVEANRSAAGLWLSNTGEQPLHAQVRAYHWSQAQGRDELVPAPALIVSPPLVELQAGARQFVRVIRSGGAPADHEDAFRIVIDELPIDEPAPHAPTREESAIRFVLRYSVPVFLAPSGSAVQAELEGEIDSNASPPRLVVRNRGGMHAQLGNLVLVEAGGQRRELSSGLVGYVLAGQTMHWDLPVDKAMLTLSGELQSRINGEPRERKVASLGASRP
jgi:fimbrial chaperone protein